MRASFNIDADLIRQIQALAERTDQPVDAVIEDVLRARLKQTNGATPSAISEFPVSRCRGGVLPGINLDKTSALV